MAQFQLLRCSVALDGDIQQVVVRGRDKPLMFPELLVLQFLHGEHAVTDIHVVGTCEMAQDEALIRLRFIYGEEAVAKVFPGARPRLPTEDRSIPICTKPIHVPKPTQPAHFDPKLRPLDQYTMPQQSPEDVEAMPGYDQPEPYQEDNGDDDEFGVNDVIDTRPKVEDLPQTRTSFRGQARQARDKPSTLPDVEGRQRIRKSGEHDHDRPKG